MKEEYAEQFAYNYCDRRHAPYVVRLSWNKVQCMQCAYHGSKSVYEYICFEDERDRFPIPKYIRVTGKGEDEVYEFKDGGGGTYMLDGSSRMLRPSWRKSVWKSQTAPQWVPSLGDNGQIVMIPAGTNGTAA